MINRHSNLFNRQAIALSAAMALLLFCPPVRGQPAPTNNAILTTVISFNGTNGAYPKGLVLANNTLYGVTDFGGTYGTLPQNANGYGSVFQMTTGGSLAWSFLFKGTNGANPNDGMVLASDGYLYGTTIGGGTATNQGLSEVFKMSTSGALVWTAPLQLNAGWNSYGGLVQALNGSLYGTVSLPGGVFAVSTAGAVTPFASFQATNGQFPRSVLVQGPDGSFYGTTQYGGTNYYSGPESGLGTVFKVTPEGAIISLLSFNGTNGALPASRLALGTDGYLYGTTEYGGSDFRGTGTWPPINYGSGTVFKMAASGALVWSLPLYAFSSETPLGFNPTAGLIQAQDGNFCGVTSGGRNNAGTVFEVTRDGVLTTLHAFSGPDGAFPSGELVQAADGSFYGATAGGGAYTNHYASAGCGTVFHLVVSSPAPGIQDSPIAVIGFNRDVVVPNTATGGNTAPYAQPFNPAAGNTFYEAGLGDLGSWAYGNGSEGLPQSGVFTSLLDGVTVFQFAPYTTNNVLYLNYNLPSATLYLAVPAAYNSLSTLAASADGGGNGTLVIHFNDGTSSPPISFNAPDWWSYSSGAALTGFGMIVAGNYGVFYTQDATNLPNLYQTSVQLGALGLNSKPIVSLTFTMPGGPGASTNTDTGVFALSGTPAPPAFQNLSLTTLITFNGTNGASPTGLVLAGDTLYGATEYGGILSPFSSGYGSVFEMAVDGSPAWSFLFNGANGANPNGGMVLASDGYLYGTTFQGGTATNTELAEVFKMSTDGALVWRAPLQFGAGYETYGGLLEGQNGGLYGCVGLPVGLQGGIFEVSTAGAVSPVASFQGTDGEFPRSALVQGADGSFYGTTQYGGTNGYSGPFTGWGTVFKITPDGSIVSLLSFNGANGAYPTSRLAFGTDGYLYGTTRNGGSDFQWTGSGFPSNYGSGTVFKIATNGTLAWSRPLYAASSNTPLGFYPTAGLVQARDGNLYGVTSGGRGNAGTVFTLTTNGVLTTLYAFSGPDGASPSSELVQAADGSFYGATASGGAFTNAYPVIGGCGTIFHLVVPAPAPAVQSVARSGNSLFITWSTVAGDNYQVQYKSDLNQPSWQNLGAAFTAANGATTTLDAMTNSQRFYRLMVLP